MNLSSVGLCAIAALIFAPQVFRSGTDAVTVDVLATDGRRPIVGLSAADFELRDCGVLQRIEDVQIAEVPFSMTLVLDTSSSVQGKALEDLKGAALAAIESLRPDDRASLFVFGEDIRHVATWNDPRTALASSISSLAAGGSTNLFDAVTAALLATDPEPGRRNLLVLLTDGDDTSSWLPMEAPLDIALRTDVVVESVVVPGDRDAVRTSLDAEKGTKASPTLALRSGIRLTPEQPVLSSINFVNELAARTGGEMVTTTSGRLRQLFVSIVSRFRSRYVLTYSPTGVDAHGWHPIKVSLKHHSGKVIARRGYER